MFFQQIGPVQRLVRLGHIGEGGSLLCCQVAWVLQQRPAEALEAERFACNEELFASTSVVTVSAGGGRQTEVPLSRRQGQLEPDSVAR